MSPNIKGLKLIVTAPNNIFGFQTRTKNNIYKKVRENALNR